MAQFKNFMAAARKPNVLAFGLFPMNFDVSWIAAYPLMPPLVIPDGTIDGVNAVFTVDAQYSQVWVIKNGLIQNVDVDYTYDSDLGKITFLSGSIPQIGDIVKVALFTASTEDIFQVVVSPPATTKPTVEVPAGSIDGANDTFTLSAVPDSLQLYLNGVRLVENVGFTLTSDTITMLSAYIPKTSDSLVAVFW